MLDDYTIGPPICTASHQPALSLRDCTWILASNYTPADLASASTIPSRWYLDPRAFLDRERERVFARTWQPVAFAKTVAEPGTFAAAEIVGEPVVVARAKDGVLRAFSNVCRHRASVIADGSGKSSTLRCPYHGWTYALDGRGFWRARNLKASKIGKRRPVRLPQYRVETWGLHMYSSIRDASALTLSQKCSAAFPSRSRE